MRYIALALVLFIQCPQNGNKDVKTSATVTYSNDTIPRKRNQVSKTAVASYMIPINNPLLKQYFGAKIYETPRTFQYVVKMQYEGMIESDTLNVPNFGTWPIVQVRKGPEQLSCIIGFLDKEKNFKEYKMVSAKDDKLRLTTLRHYAVGVYSNSR